MLGLVLVRAGLRIFFCVMLKKECILYKDRDKIAQNHLPYQAKLSMDSEKKVKLALFCLMD